MYSYSLDGPEYSDYCETPREQKLLEDRIEDAANFLGAIINDLYSKQPLDKGLLEWRLDELCDKLGVPINVGTLEIERRNSTIESLAQYMARSPF
jgi:hypothetical protein